MAGRNTRFLEKSSIKLNLTKKLMTPYGGFALVAKLFEKLELQEQIEQIFPVVESSPKGTGIYVKVLQFGLRRCWQEANDSATPYFKSGRSRWRRRWPEDCGSTSLDG